MGKIGITAMLIFSMMMISPLTKTRAAAPVTSAVTFIVLRAASWLIRNVLRSAKQALLAAASRPNPPEASANVNGAFWTTNAVGTRKDETAMETSEAEVYLMNQRCSVKTVTYELFTTDYSPQDNHYQPSGAPYDGFLEDVYVTARADCLEQEKAKVLKQMNDDTLYFGTEYEISQMTFKVGSFKMGSIFPPTAWLDLGHDTSDEAGDDEYKGRLYWKYCGVLEDGSWDQIDAVTRTFAVKPIMKQQRMPKMLNKGISIWTGHYTTNTVRACTKVEVVRYEKEYRIEQQSN